MKKIVLAAMVAFAPGLALAQSGTLGNSMGTDASAQPTPSADRTSGTPGMGHHTTKGNQIGAHHKMKSTSHAGSMSKGGNTSAPDTGMAAGNAMSPQ